MRTLLLALAFVTLAPQAHADDAAALGVQAALNLCPRLFAGEKPDEVLRAAGFASTQVGVYARKAGEARIEAPVDQFSADHECAFEIFSATTPSEDVLRGVETWAQAAAAPPMGLVEERKESRDAEGLYWTSTLRSKDRAQDWILTVEEYPKTAGDSVIARVFLATR